MTLPLGLLALLLAVPSIDGTWQHNPTHFWLVAALASINVVAGHRISKEAAERADARLVLVALGFTASAALFTAHALATPRVVVAAPGLGFSLSMPAGLLLAAVCASLSSVSWERAASDRIVGAAAGLQYGVVGLAVVWVFLALSDVPPLDRTLDPGRYRAVVAPLTILTILLFTIAAIRYWRLHRRRPSPVALALVTSFVLLGDAMVIVNFARNWQASWWLWHVVVFIGYAYVFYAVYTEYRAEGRPGWLFASIGLDATVSRLRAEWGNALERLVRGIESDHIDADAAAADVGERFGLTTGQTQILAQAGTAVATERRRGRVLGAMSRLTHGHLAETSPEELAAVAASALGDALETPVDVWFTDEPPPAHLASVRPGDLDGIDARLFTAGADRVMVYPIRRGGEPVAALAVVVSPGREPEDDRELIGSFASHLGLTMENLSLYRDLRRLFGSYVSPELASRLLEDPSRAALGGSVVETTILFADLRGFTHLSESIGEPGDVVAVLNRYLRTVVPIVLDSGGTVDKFVGDALMAVYNTPVLQPDHALRAVTAAWRMQHAVEALAMDHQGWPRFRVGVNTGVALVGNIGSDEFRNYTAIGDAVNVASRLETSADPGEVLIGATTHALVSHSVRTERVGFLEVKGRDAAVEAYRVVGLDEPGTDD
jgi:class 3 adenylate cyclase